MYANIILATFALLGLAAAAEPSAALGINCRGSSNCGGADGTMEGVLRAVAEHRRWDHFEEGEHIGCDGHLCAFFQNGASGSAGDASALINEMIGHGCQKCGSDPVTIQNDVGNGELTVNWVSSP